MKQPLITYLRSVLIFFAINYGNPAFAVPELDMITFTPALLEALGSSSFTAAVHDQHGPDFSRAIIDIESQVGSGSTQVSIRNGSSYRYHLHGVDSGGTKTHFQGVGFLREVTIDGAVYRRAVLSYNYGPGLSFSAGNVNADADDFTARGSDGVLRFLDRQVYLDIMGEASMGNHNHPGGLQAHGDLVAIAMEQPITTGDPAAVYFIQMDNLAPRFITSLRLGTGGAPPGLNTGGAAASGFVKLETGFLVAVAGISNGTHGTWFYVTSDNRISPTTEWRFIDFWTPDRLPGGVCDINDGKHSLECYVGAGGSVNLLANHTGDIYMFVTTGTDGGGKDDEYVQMLRVSHLTDGEGSDSIELTPLWSDKRTVGRLAMKQYSMRWSGAAQATDSGQLMLLNSERGRRKQGPRNTSDGMIYVNPSR